MILNLDFRHAHKLSYKSISLAFFLYGVDKIRLCLRVQSSDNTARERRRPRSALILTYLPAYSFPPCFPAVTRRGECALGGELSESIHEL